MRERDEKRRGRGEEEGETFRSSYPFRGGKAKQNFSCGFFLNKKLKDEATGEVGKDFTQRKSLCRESPKETVTNSFTLRASQVI